MFKYIRLALALALLLAVAAPPPTVQAEYWKGEVYWYADTAHTKLVGYFVRYCDNSTYQWGQQGPWGVHYTFYCDDDPPPVQ